jgi:hypothetical protein
MIHMFTLAKMTRAKPFLSKPYLPMRLFSWSLVHFQWSTIRLLLDQDSTVQTMLCRSRHRLLQWITCLKAAVTIEPSVNSGLSVKNAGESSCFSLHSVLLGFIRLQSPEQGCWWAHLPEDIRKMCKNFLTFLFSQVKK